MRCKNEQNREIGSSSLGILKFRAKVLTSRGPGTIINLSLIHICAQNYGPGGECRASGGILSRHQPPGAPYSCQHQPGGNKSRQFWPQQLSQLLFSPPQTAVYRAQRYTCLLYTSRSLVAACCAPVNEGMEVFTNTPKVLDSRKKTLQLILSTHKMCIRDRPVTLPSPGHKWPVWHGGGKCGYTPHSRYTAL